MKVKTGTEKGFTLIEVLVAIAMIAVGVLGLAANTVSVTQGNRISASTTVAINLAQEKIDGVAILDLIQPIFLDVGISNRRGSQAENEFQILAGTHPACLSASNDRCQVHPSVTSRYALLPSS